MQSAVESGKLLIPVAKPMDSGDYTCRVVGVSGVYQDVASLSVEISELIFHCSEITYFKSGYLFWLLIFCIV